ncbi:MAG: glycosyltransferase family 39 protein [Candidatus Binatia bacterium]|jgi:4-amino-4-deoxy-L-arabinose transferase-like glycosyltransferase
MTRSRPVRGRDWVLLALLCAALYGPGLTAIPPVDRDEPHFAQATKQMVQSGYFALPPSSADIRVDKPVGIYWLQAAAVLTTAGRGCAVIWPYRLPSVLGATVAVLLTYWLGRRLFARQVALLGAAFLASCVLLVVEAHLATTDAALLACVVAAQACLAALYAAARRGHTGARSYAAGFWIAQGIGVLIKGPIIVLVSGLTLATLLGLEGWHAPPTAANQRLRTGLRWHWGIVLMLAISVPWIVVAGWATHGAFYQDWFSDVALKAVSIRQSHGGPPGSYVVLAAVTFWPASFATALGLVRALGRRTRTAERFCLAWIIPTWLFFEFMPTKLPHYVLPAYPALALLAARSVLASPATLLTYARTVRAGFILWSGVTLAMGVLILVGAAKLGDGIDGATVFAAATATVIAVTGMRLGWRQRLLPASAVAVIGSVVLFIPILQWVVPDLGAVWLSRAASAAVARRGARPLAAVGYHEPSLVFLAATEVALLEPQDAAGFLRDRVGGLVLVSDDQRAAFARAAMDIGLSVREVWAVDGINYSKGRRTRLSLFEQAPPSTGSAMSSE